LHVFEPGRTREWSPGLFKPKMQPARAASFEYTNAGEGWGKVVFKANLILVEGSGNGLLRVGGLGPGNTKGCLRKKGGKKKEKGMRILR